jgi:CDP-paratose 2-epimerase
MAGADQGSRRVLVTGGAGFIGGSICIALKRQSADLQVTALDNLKRRGAELNLPRLREAGVEFAHGDVRQLADLQALDPHDVVIECSAEPSVLAGYADTRYAFETNLIGAYNCLELARRDQSQVIFLSTSRVYPIAHLSGLALDEADTRFEIAAEQELPGVSPAGISESFPLDGARTLYGTTKLSAEMLIAEYREAFGLRATINRCGVVAGPWQMGKVDQGVFTHWLVSHYFERPLSYIGYGGTGKQVRDLLHVSDLVELISRQLADPGSWDGATLNVGGGRSGSLSLLETTAICEDLTGNSIAVGSDPDNRTGDVPVYLSDCAALEAVSDWRPVRTPREILGDIFDWVQENEKSLRSVLN